MDIVNKCQGLTKVLDINIDLGKLLQVQLKSYHNVNIHGPCTGFTATNSKCYKHGRASRIADFMTHYLFSTMVHQLVEQIV